jgi:hypothetical protein
VLIRLKLKYINMKNIVCPVSSERIPENLPRVTAFFVLSSLSLYLLTGFLPIVLYLAYDFLARGFGYANFSVFHKLSVFYIKKTGISKVKIDKAPKLFAARLGGIFSLLIIVFHLLGIGIVAYSLSGLLIVLSTLECVVGICVGCYFYSFLILPFYQKLN